jgi:hypothetical protein
MSLNPVQYRLDPLWNYLMAGPIAKGENGPLTLSMYEAWVPRFIEQRPGNWLTEGKI